MVFLQKKVKQRISKALLVNKSITHRLQGDDFNFRIRFEIAAEFGDVNIQISWIEEVVISPNRIQNDLSGNDFSHGLGE